MRAQSHSRPGPDGRRIWDVRRRVAEADLSYPILLCAEGRGMDGMHRVAKACLAGHGTIDAVRFETTPPPDFVNVALDDLPYDDDDV